MVSRRVPDNLGVALVAVVVSIATPFVVSKVFGADGGRFWISLAAPIAAGVALLRALRSRGGTRLDERHRLGEGARALAVLSLLLSCGVLVLNAVSWTMLVRTP